MFRMKHRFPLCYKKLWVPKISNGGVFSHLRHSELLLLFLKKIKVEFMMSVGLFRNSKATSTKTDHFEGRCLLTFRLRS